MNYKGYEAEVTYDEDAKVFGGFVAGIGDSITFQSDRVSEHLLYSGKHA